MLATPRLLILSRGSSAKSRHCPLSHSERAGPLKNAWSNRYNMGHHVATRVGHHPTRIWLYRTDVSQCNDPTDICFSVPPFSCAVMKRRRQVRRVVIRHTCPSSQPPLFSPNKSARGQGNCKTFSQHRSQNSIHYHLAALVICPKALSVPIGAILSLWTPSKHFYGNLEFSPNH